MLLEVYARPNTLHTVMHTNQPSTHRWLMEEKGYCRFTESSPILPIVATYFPIKMSQLSITLAIDR